MTEAKCFKCGASIPLVLGQTSAACLKCGTAYYVTDNGAVPRLGSSVQAAPKERDYSGVLMIIILGVALALIGLVMYNEYQKREQSLTEAESAENAYLSTHDIIGQALVSPGSAEWCPLSDSSVTAQSNHRWIVESCVDSQNKLGALLRLNYTAEVQFVGDGQWQLLNIETDK